jgi:hypothetical protein
MRCEEYIERFFAAHADDELIGRERRAADQHAGRCPRCRARLEDERRLKALIRTHAFAVRVPSDLRMSIRSALGAMPESYTGTRRTWRGAAHQAARAAARATRRVGARRALIGLPIAAAAVFVLLLASSYRHDQILAVSVPPTPIFDLALNKFDSLSEAFVPNVPAQAAVGADSDYAWVMSRDSHGRFNDESADLAEAYRDADVPEDIYDLETAGYGLSGGRVDPARDGWLTSYTLYRGAKGEILSICLHAPNFSAPIGAQYWVGAHTFYEYQGHSLCLTFHPAGHFVSILVAREPVEALLRDMTAAGTSTDL